MKHTIFKCRDNEKILYYGCGCDSKGALGTNENSYSNIVVLTLMNDLWTIKNIRKLLVSWNNTLILTSDRIFLMKMMEKSLLQVGEN